VRKALDVKEMPPSGMDECRARWDAQESGYRMVQRWAKMGQSTG
jgi:hypothetical protein